MKRHGIFIAVLTAVFLLVSCGAPKWYSDFDSAKEAAKKQKKDIYLLFSGDDWAETSKPFKEKIVLTKDFSDEFGKKYVFANLDFSQTEYAKTNVPENASEDELKAAAEIKESYEKKELLARYYNVRKWPCAYLVSKDGYVLASVDFEEKPECTFEEYSAKMKDAGQEALKTKVLVEKVENSSGIEKAQAINELVENTSQEHCFLLKDLIQEFIVLDKQDSTGLLGAYEVRNAYNKSLEAFAEGKDPAEPFEQIAEKTSLSDLQRQEAMYMAAYVLVNLPDIDFERVQQCLEKAYSIKTEGGYSEEILKALETVRKFSAMKKSQENQK
ncbi:thioredoxin family protein [Treponema succinifaciens]|uniref:thioredoxin family protein n=1 Tax=Treponema succinifaciens TaxID=167 RepID=UPI0023F91CD3|nr:thioredoxin family protein [Treponema succinifaciens]